MRILVLSGQWFPDLRGGSARVATETAHRLARRGHEVIALVPRTPGLPAEDHADGVSTLRVLRRSFLPRTLTDVVETARHARRLGGERFDVVLAHQSTAAAGARLALLQAPLALVFHASARRELQFLRPRLAHPAHRAASYPLEGALALLERTAAAAAERVLVLSEFSRGLLETDHSDLARRIRLVRGGVDVEAFHPGEGPLAERERLGIEPDATVLLTVRRLEPRMGLEQLLRALALLPADGPSLVVVGTGTLDAPLRALAAELGLGGRVRFTGAVPDGELAAWYRAADLFVLPTVAYEGFGMVTAEALASGTPVVGTAVGATPELLEPLDPALVSETAEPAVLATAIERSLAAAGADLRRRCREYALARLAWDAVMPDWERALEEAAGTPTFERRRPRRSSGAPPRAVA